MSRSLASMTGYARAAGAVPGASFTCEIKSVNGRGLDIRMRLAPGGKRRVGAGAGLDIIHFLVDLELGAHDRREHARKELGAVDQQFELVAIPPGEDRPRHISGR